MTSVPAVNSGTSIGEEVKGRALEASDAAKTFMKYFYEGMDKKRHTMAKLYHEKATLIWNGNSIAGSADIQKFLDGLPASEHKVEILDCQPVTNTATQGQTSIIIAASGLVKYDGSNKLRNFFQNFVLIVVNSTWKVTNDCFRYTD